MDEPTDQLLRRLLGSADRELLCDECFEALDEYVDLELRGRPADREIAGMRAHLDGCPACREEHESLRALVRAQGRPEAGSPPAR
jgi:anti-sigma factor RsiW